MLTSGGVFTFAMMRNVIAADVVTAPLLSVALAVIVWLPTGALFHTKL
jgi:hypothetical protein